MSLCFQIKKAKAQNTESNILKHSNKSEPMFPNQKKTKIQNAESTILKHANNSEPTFPNKKKYQKCRKQHIKAFEQL